MEGIGELGSNLQDFSQRLRRERVIECLVDIRGRHAAGEALEDLGNRPARPTNGQLAAQELRIGHYPPIILIRVWLPV